MSSDKIITCSPVPEGQRNRYSRLSRTFKDIFKTDPTTYARAPGRVNIIGEHVDYCGYAVLPMALEQDIVTVVKVNDSGKLVLHNTEPSFKPYECDVREITIDKNKPEWQKYFLCGVKGLLDHANVKESLGMDCLVDGTVPNSAGLSSSSALVCCAALACMHANGLSVSRCTLAEVCARSERYIGTEGGGMDQAISFLAEAGTAKLIEFNPLSVHDVALPDGASFVVTNSCVRMNKAATAHFNIRVVECRLGTQIIAASKGLAWRATRKPRELQEALGVAVRDMPAIVDDVLHDGVYSKQEVCDILAVSARELADTSLSENTLDVRGFKLRDRLRHVFGESGRVYEFKETCDDQPANCLQRLGELMDASHASCRDLYQCTCPELDELVTQCRNSGALGSRMTGAGWGGCAVSLVSTRNVAEFVSKVTKGFYDVGGERSKRIEEKMFTTQPGRGAALYVAEDWTLL